ncbi:RNA polymerase-associated protein Rtf1-like [Drosophila hydei]|uniref:RNA polymerase-associated protein Rtf1-like n=1 Tax=Drosophila hydei TaxID=7224 RepID=A0A6J2SWJ6_DROHY|nr:RNA polymerase-associated protein Rtf1-like [Drosophila hydei]
MLNLKSRKRHLGFTEDLEDGELPDVDACDVRPIHPTQSVQTLGQFTDGYDDNLLGDAADRARLESLSELERESELYERSLKREELLYKWGIKCFLLSKEKHSGAVDSSSALPDIAVALKERSSTRRLNLEAQRAADKRRSAIDRLVAQRNSKKTKDDYECKHVTAEEQDPEREQELLQEQPQQRGQEPVQLQVQMHESDQARGDTPKHVDSKKLKLKARDVYSDESSGSTDDEDYIESSSPNSEPETLVSSLKELSKALLTRTQLESFLDKPIFEQTVVGCFVRISLSGIPNNQPAIYRLTRIVAVEPIEQEYLLGNHRTKLKLQLQHGSHLRSFQMDVVSNQPVINNEFIFWLDACQRDAQPLPSVKSIDKKEKDIEKATNYAFTEGDVELMVQTKRRAGQKPVSAAYRKVCLIMERDMAVDCNDVEKANQLEKQIKQIDEQSLSEHQREKRVQYMSLNDTAPVRVPFTEPASKSKPKKFDWQQYMRRRYKKFAHLNSLQTQQVPRPMEETMTKAAISPALPATQSAVNKPVLEQVKVAEETNIDKLDLYELHNFEVNLDVSKLMQFSDICKEIEGMALDVAAVQ